MFYLHQNYYKQVNEYLKTYKIEHNSYPTHEDFKVEALKILDNVYNRIRPEIVATLN